MSTTADVFTYHTVEALQALSLNEVEALWELVPTERQRYYVAVYERTRRDEGASGSDAIEEVLLTQLIARYNEVGKVPVDAYWAATPSQLREAAQADTEWTPPPDVVRGAKPPPLLLIGAALSMLVLGFLLLRGMNASGSGTAAALTGTPGPRLARTYTPTPLALDAQDAIIRGGVAGSGQSATYPVNLRIALPGVAQPRLFVVQRRIVNTTEWQYDDNPDVASYLVGLAVHPVLGIPWSDANTELFREAAPGTIVSVQMNTGAVQRFITSEQREIGRGDTSSFAQTRPGLTLVLFGQPVLETDAPTTDRRLILLADYVPTLDDGLSAAPTIVPPTPMPTPTAAQRIDVDVIRATVQPGRLSLRMRIFNGRTEPLRLDSSSIWLTYGYSPRPTGPQVAAEIQPVTLEPYQAADMALTFAWAGEPYGLLDVLDEYQFSLTFR